MATKLQELRAVIGSESNELKLRKLLIESNYDVNVAINKHLNSQSKATPASRGRRTAENVGTTTPKAEICAVESGEQSEGDVVDLLSDNSDDDYEETTPQATSARKRPPKRKIINLLSSSAPENEGPSSTAWITKVKASLAGFKHNRKRAKSSPHEATELCAHQQGPDCALCNRNDDDDMWARLGQRIIEGASTTRGRCTFNAGDQLLVWPDQVKLDPASGRLKKRGRKPKNLFGGRKAKSRHEYVRFGRIEGKAIGRFDTGPAESLALLLNADLVRVSAVAYVSFPTSLCLARLRH